MTLPQNYVLIKYCTKVVVSETHFSVITIMNRSELQHEALFQSSTFGYALCYYLW